MDFEQGSAPSSALGSAHGSAYDIACGGVLCNVLGGFLWYFFRWYDDYRAGLSACFWDE